MHHRTTLVLLAVFAVALVGACSQQESMEEGPGGVVQNFYSHLNEGDYGAAKALYSSDALAVIDDPEFSSPEAFQTWAIDHTRQGTIDSVSIVGTEEDEAQTLVEYQVNYSDGSTVTHEVTVTQEDGVWKMGLLG